MKKRSRSKNSDFSLVADSPHVTALAGGSHGDPFSVLGRHTVGESEVDYAVPRTADGTELWIQYSTPEYAVPTTADGTVRWITYTTDFALPRSADGKVMWFGYLTPQVPRTADGAEGWILGVQASETPVLLQMRPMGQVPEGVSGEMSYLPVTPPTTVVPGEQIQLVVQPVFRPAA